MPKNWSFQSKVNTREKAKFHFQCVGTKFCSLNAVSLSIADVYLLAFDSNLAFPIQIERTLTDRGFGRKGSHKFFSKETWFIFLIEQK